MYSSTKLLPCQHKSTYKPKQNFYLQTYATKTHKLADTQSNRLETRKKTQHWDSDHNNRIELNSKYKQNLCESNATKVKGYIPMLEFHLQHNQFAIQGKPKREKHNIANACSKSK
jgi:hypothetical protein